MKLKITYLLCISMTLAAWSQYNQLSPNAEISVLTVGPGTTLNDAFGHNAFRINDRASGLDIVFGYGEYDFDTPNFYLKFAQGKLNYKISKDNFREFYYQYVTYYNRTIEEQVLNLSVEQKQRLYEYLVNNYKPENRKYLYDFFYDNCATRIRDVVQIATNDNIEFTPPKNFEAKTFRQLIYEHTGRNNWGSFGIDLALGSVIDKKATPYEHMFLPKYIHEFFGNAELQTKDNLVKKSSVIYQQREQQHSTGWLFSPIAIFSMLALVIGFITYTDKKKKKQSKWLDVCLFGITGLLGVGMLLLWFATDHTATANNYNLLWAVPLNLLVIGQLLRPKVNNWFKRYLKFLIIMLCLMTFHWIVGVQTFAIGLIPLLVALAIRYVYLIYVYSGKK